MSSVDNLLPVCTFRVQIEREGRIIMDAVITAREQQCEIDKAKKSVQRLLNEYTPNIKVPEPDPPDRAKAALMAAEDPAAGQGHRAKAVQAPQKEPDGVRGFLLLGCPECGNIFGTFLREYQTEITCKCGCQIDLAIQLGRFAYTCPHCGQTRWGRTNLEDPEIKAQCKCGENILMHWIPGKKEYQN